MIIYGERCSLRTFFKSDWKVFYSIAHEESVKAYVPYAYPNDIIEAKEMTTVYSEGDLKNDFYLLIEYDQKVVGVIIAIKTMGNFLDTSAFIAKPYRSKGLMTDAMKLFIKWLSENTEYEELHMDIEMENKASNRQILKIGGEKISTVAIFNTYSVKIE